MGRAAGLAHHDFKAGDEVLAFVGTKSGYGVVKSIVDSKFALVEFPDAGYPLTMVQPTGLYMVPFTQMQSWKPPCGYSTECKP